MYDLKTILRIKLFEVWAQISFTPEFCCFVDSYSAYAEKASVLNTQKIGVNYIFQTN